MKIRSIFLKKGKCKKFKIFFLSYFLKKIRLAQGIRRPKAADSPLLLNEEAGQIVWISNLAWQQWVSTFKTLF